MARRALGPGIGALLVAFIVGAIVGGPGTGVSAALGVGVILANFVANVLAIAWARGVSLVAIQVVAYAGFVIRLGIVLALLFGLQAFGWFDPAAFGLAALGSAILLLVYESKLVLSGLGSELQLSPPAGSAADGSAPGPGGETSR
jgi:hypothetical protein